jgi:hypothetical protein
MTIASSILTLLLGVVFAVAVFGVNLWRFKDDALRGNGVESSVNPGVLLPTSTKLCN